MRISAMIWGDMELRPPSCVLECAINTLLLFYVDSRGVDLSIHGGICDQWRICKLGAVARIT